MKYFLTLVFVAVTSHIYGQPPIGSKVPDISLPDINGNIIKLSSLKGKVVVLDFWASWCGPCRKSNHEMLPVYKKYKDKGLEIYGVSIDADPSMWGRAIEKDEITWLQVNDRKGTRGSDLMTIWAVRFIPSTFIIDREGVLRASLDDPGQLRRWVKKLL